MFGRKKNNHSEGHGPQSAPTWDIPVFFGLMFLLSIAELFFTIDSFQYLQKTHTWHSTTERARLAFLIFSCVRTIALSAVYLGFHCATKIFHSMFHTIFLVISTILWVVSGVLIHTMWGFIICNQGVGPIKGGLTECHELKIIEIIAWVLAGVSVIATVPVVINSTKRRKREADMKKTHNSG
ncbi:uncharacterized protein LY89DRAFT_780193 [Mollisia scopiformis]|uniref:Uncharacterized protein n=1 Tax=Mollisia scopiformis TaxID=149040 RepID=A0A194XG66_MOLSC|nr:uncharacterized protein LY89DRAFT_780193 [Mollisia scopiformis]KUJ19190.1 hypothetical protein LY89DRAFT_780193 [Mollisia scopiformis]